MADVLAVDVQYRDIDATAAGVVFDWADAKPRRVVTTTVSPIAEYVPGEFYRRELPCILAVLDHFRSEHLEVDQLNAIVVDGHVFVNDAQSPGLGAHLWNALNEAVPVIGVAKASFRGNASTVVEVKRGQSGRPLYVSAIGIDTYDAAGLIEAMHGPHRIPTILKLVDSLARR
jgi:deoxyribonuclease V